MNLRLELPALPSDAAGSNVERNRAWWCGVVDVLILPPQHFHRQARAGGVSQVISAGRADPVCRPHENGLESQHESACY